MYLAFYNLKEAPFELTPDPRFLHLAQPHRTVLTALLQGVILRKGFLVLTGPVGTGKTTLLHAMLQILSRVEPGMKKVLTAFLVNPLLNRDEFLEAVLEEFEIPCPGATKPRHLAALTESLLAAQRQGGTAVLIVDEAHLLIPELLEEIRLLSNVDTHRQKLLQIVLCGQPELLGLLAKPETYALRQRIAGRCQLRPLSLAETRSYVAERLYAAGLRGPSPFLATALESVFRYTQGVPRLINLLCDACLCAGFESGNKSVDPAMVEIMAGALDLSDARENSESHDDHHAEAKPKEPASSVDLLIETLRNARAAARSNP
jgi:general secretion pathway protein A